MIANSGQFKGKGGADEAASIVPGAAPDGGVGGVTPFVHALRQDGVDLARILADHDARHLPITAEQTAKWSEVTEGLLASPNERCRATGAKLLAVGLSHNLKLATLVAGDGKPTSPTVNVLVLNIPAPKTRGGV